MSQKKLPVCMENEWGFIGKEIAVNRWIDFQHKNPDLQLQKGQWIKIGLPVNGVDYLDGAEWTWVKVIEVDNDNKKGHGVIDNEIVEAPYQIGDIIPFDYKEVCEVTS